LDNTKKVTNTVEIRIQFVSDGRQSTRIQRFL
jgi:hypothetical protein